MTKRILDIVDMQNDFMNPKGALYVQDAETIIPKANAFLADIQKGDFDLALVKFDTHFEESYAKNPESELFPPHCIFDSWGWKMAVDLPNDFAAKVPVFKMTKNVFNMWAAKPVIKGVKFANTFNKRAYKKLFKTDGKARDKFIKKHKIGAGSEVVMMGVASDYCVHDAMEGYLKRGAKVIVLSDLVKGIGTDVPGRALSGTIEDVVKLDVFKPYVEKGQLVVMTSDEFKAEMRKEVKNVTRPKNMRRPA